MKHFLPQSRSAGFSLVSVTILITIILAFAAGMAAFTMSSRNAGKTLEATLTSTQIAEAGISKALFCLRATSGTKCGGTYSTNYVGETNIPFGNGKYTTTVNGTGPNRTIVSVGNNGKGKTRTISVDATTIPETDSTGGPGYALQSGDGGATLQNNARIQGTLYANGDVTCQGILAVAEGDIWVSKPGGKIDSCRTNFNSHADRILNGRVDGDAYYKNDPADIAGTTVIGNKFANSPTPEAEPLPSYDLPFWRQSAEAGGTIFGDYHPADNSQLGPVKIVGNLILDQNVDITVMGPIWVVGNILTYNNASFTLFSGFGANSTFILADDPTDMVNKGRITLINGTGVYGSGDPKSHIMFAGTNSSMDDVTPALSVANNANGAVFMAFNGVLRLQSNAGAKSLAAKRLYLDQNAVVTYVESELADIKFSNSPSGVWRIKGGTWRESN